MATLYFDGEIDLVNSPELTARVVEALQLAPSSVEVDLAGVTFLGSSGLNALITARKAALAIGVPFVVVNPSRQVLRILDVTALTAVLLRPATPIAEETFPPPAE